MSSNSETLSVLGSKLQGKISPTNVGYTKVEIRIGVDGAVASTFREAFVQAVEMKLSMSNKTLPVTREQLVNYLNYVVYARVCHVTSDHKCLWKRNDTYFVPAFLFVFSEQIGRVENADLGLLLMPVWEGDVPEMDIDTLNRVSMFLNEFEMQHNATMRRGLSKDSKGSWETMSFELVDGQMRNLTNLVPPEHSVIASFFAVNGLATVMGADAFRVNYGSTQFFENFAYEVVNG